MNDPIELRHHSGFQEANSAWSQEIGASKLMRCNQVRPCGGDRSAKVGEAMASETPIMRLSIFDCMGTITFPYAPITSRQNEMRWAESEVFSPEQESRLTGGLESA